MDYLIVTGGRIDEAFALSYLEEHSFYKIIAVDSGMDFLYSVNLKPDYIVGDFDSANPLALEYFKTMENINIIQLMPEKDETDTEHAMKMAMELGASKITIIGATGSRLDHLLGNISLLGIGLENGVSIEMVDGHNRIRMIDKDFEIDKATQFGKYVSLIPFTTTVEGLTLKGFKYPLDDFTMGGYNSLGVSNEIAEDKAQILIKKGSLIVIESKD